MTEHLPEPAARRPLLLWQTPVLVLVAVWLFQAFASGGYLPRQWLPGGLIVAAVVLVLFGLGALPGVPSRVPLTVAGLLAAYTLWMIISALWAPSDGSVWMAAGRSVVYLLVFVVGLTMFQTAGGRAGLKYGLAAGAAVLAIVCVWRLLSLADPAIMFIEDRLAYPVGYPNNAASLYLIPFWPLVWLAADPRERWYVRGPVLGVATALLMLALMTQSRGAFWAFAFAVVALLLLSPARLRTLVFLVVTVGLTAFASPALNLYWSQGPVATGHGPLLARFIPCVAAAVAFGCGAALVEPRLRLTSRLRALTGAAAVILMVGGAFGALVASGGSLTASLNSIGAQWSGFINDLRGVVPDVSPSTTGGETSNPSRFLIPGSSGRWDLWRVAWLNFEAAPVLGVGAGNYVFTYNRDRIRDRYGRDAHSLPLGALAETGFVGGLLLLGGLGLGVGAVLTPRVSRAILFLRRSLRRGPPVATSPSFTPDYGVAWNMALLTAVVYWLLHSTVDWLWEMPAVTMPALLCLSLALAQVGSPCRVRTRTSWYRWGVTGVAAVAVVALGMPYMALKYDDMAVANAVADPTRALQYARVAASLAPVDPEPLLVQERLYRAAATSSAAPGARLDNLALALDAAEKATERDPANWVVLLQAAKAADALAQAMHSAQVGSAEPPGVAAGSLAVTTSGGAIAARYRNLSPDELSRIARSYATRAREWNPKEPQAEELLARLPAGE